MRGARPRTRAASTYSFDTTDTVSVWAMRANPGANDAPTARTLPTDPMPNSTAKKMASSSAGNDKEVDDRAERRPSRRESR